MVILILSVIALIIAPAGGASDDARLMAAGRLLVADLDHARLRSLGSAADRCVVVFEPGGAGYHLARQSDPLTPVSDLATGLPYRRWYGHDGAPTLTGVAIDPSGVGGDGQLAFTALGRIDQSADATITLWYGARTLTVEIDAGTGEPGVRP